MNAALLITGNVCSLLAMFTDSISATRKTAKGMLMVQNVSQLFYIIGGIVLRGYSSAAQNFVSILRNIVAIRQIKSIYVEWALVILGLQQSGPHRLAAYFGKPAVHPVRLPV